MQRQDAGRAPLYSVLLFLLMVPVAAFLASGKSVLPKAAAKESPYRVAAVETALAAIGIPSALPGWPVIPGAIGGDIEEPSFPFYRDITRIDWPAVNTAEAELADARAYLIKTARPSFTMMVLGRKKALECFLPQFAVRLSDAIREARASGLPDAGVFSGCRWPILNVGGFANKFLSMHAYGNAADMAGIGRPGSTEAAKWKRIAEKHGLVRPYVSASEWNHFQLYADRVAPPALRKTINANGSPDLERTWRVAKAVLGKQRGKSKQKHQRVASR